MNVGDKVRMMSAAGEGVISKIIDEQTVEVEIEDGFQIPVLKREVVVVSKQEARYFGEDAEVGVGRYNEPASTQAAKGQAKAKSAKPKNRAVLSAKGIYLAFVPLNDQNLALYLVNNTDYTLPFSIAEEKVRDLYGLDAGVIQAGSYQKLGERS
ncbi:MAG: DNA mismatch repair protein MutS, partial [Bacteroidota bacterium]